jgi:hypothetical protein
VFALVLAWDVFAPRLRLARAAAPSGPRAAASATRKDASA